MIIPWFLIVLFLLSLVTGGIFLWLNKGKTDKRTWIYLAIFVVIGALMGGLAYMLNMPKGANWRYSQIYLIMQLVFLILGILNAWLLYPKLFWAYRDAERADRDSFWAEGLFTLTVCILSVLALLVSFILISGKSISLDNRPDFVFWTLIAVFVLPFFVLKGYDFLNQIPARNFDVKWTYPTHTPLEPNRWQWEHKVWVNFDVADSLENERKWRVKRAKFSVEMPREQSLENAFRLALREHHDRGPAIPVQDLGYERSRQGDFWWLFKIKCIIWRPNTWFRKNRYLDPYISIVENGLRQGDVVKAQRMFY
jgi:hypothetical protein